MSEIAHRIRLRVADIAEAEHVGRALSVLFDTTVDLATEDGGTFLLFTVDARYAPLVPVLFGPDPRKAAQEPA